jgi:hypothetical protein
MPTPPNDFLPSIFPRLCVIITLEYGRTYGTSSQSRMSQVKGYYASRYVIQIEIVNTSNIKKQRNNLSSG